MQREGVPPRVHDGIVKITLHRLAGVFSEPAFWVFFIVTAAISVFSSIGWGVSPTFQLAVLLPLLIAFIASYIITGISTFSGKLYYEETSPRSEEYARWEFEMTQKLSRAHSLMRHGVHDEAAEFFEQVLHLDAANLEARLDLAHTLHRHLNRTDDAIGHYRTVLEQAPMDTLLRDEAKAALAEIARKGRHTGPV